MKGERDKTKTSFVPLFKTRINDERKVDPSYLSDQNAH